MPLRAGFAEIDITPPVGTEIIGWLRKVVSTAVEDPLFARAGVFESGGNRIGFLQLDLLSIRWKQVERIRQGITERFGFPGENVMVAATHNHAGPAVVHCGDARRDDAYLTELETRAVTVFGQALASMQEAEIAFGSCFEHSVAFNRRMVMRDGTVKTQATFQDPNALYVEGPVDPELAVVAVRSKGTGADGEEDAARERGGDTGIPDSGPSTISHQPSTSLGLLLNFACHPTHHGSDGVLSAGFPGALAREMKARGCPVTLFLNGAAGNLIFLNPYRGGAALPPEEVGRILAQDVERALDGAEYQDSARLDARSETVSLPFRTVTEQEVRGTARGAQRFIDSAIYDREISRVVERIRQRGSLPAQVQVLSVDELAFAAIPGEYFTELGLRIKEAAYPRRALIVGCANGMVGYVPHPEAFARGGYETTFAGSSKLAPEAGIILADAAVRLIHGQAAD